MCSHFARQVRGAGREPCALRMNIFIYTCMYTYICIYKGIYTYIYIYIERYVYIYIYR